MAIEDAVVLAQRLATAPSIPAALDAYDRTRRARIAKLVKAASRNRDAKTAGPIARRCNDVIMPIFFRNHYEKATSWLYTHELGQLPPPAARLTPTRRPRSA